MRKSKI